MMLVARRVGAPSLSARTTAAFVALAMLAACGEQTKDTAGKAEQTRSAEGESGLAEAGDPVRGGRLVYGLEAESSGGFCLPEAQLAISGVMVRWALYDTLAALNRDGEPVPNLAASIVPDDDRSVWTIELRDGVTFHDGTDLDATVVKNNLDAYRGTYPARKPLLTLFQLKNIATVTAKDDMTVEVTMVTPWAAFPNALTSLGIIGQSQLDDTETCSSKMVGTGPFKLASWTPDQELLAQRNPDYWQLAPDGKPYPYADAIAFRPIPEGPQRLNALEAGEIDAYLTSKPSDIAGPLTDLRNDDVINLLVTEDHTEVSFLMLNSGKPPFDDRNMRRALAMGIDRKLYNELVNDGFPTIADQPFPPGDPGYVEDPGFPDYDPEAATKLVQAYVDGGGDASMTFTSTPGGVASVEVLQNQLAAIGITGNIQTVDQATLINLAIAGDFQAMGFRHYPGGEPDSQYVWWYSVANPVNFARVKDPVIDKALDDGRAEPDPDKRRVIYERISRQFASEVWNVWLNYTPWAVALSPDVHGVLSTEIPDDGGGRFTGLAYGHPLAGMWKTSG
jgi:peptide/nickel transport system substrate-binding protein